MKFIDPINLEASLLFSHELKSTNTEDTYQEIQFYGSPSVGFGYQDVNFKVYLQLSFQIDDTVNLF